MDKYDNNKEFLFNLNDGTPVNYGDILWHPDRRQVGWFCKAEFHPSCGWVTVRTDNGAVPQVLVSELRKEPPSEPKRCNECGQILPEK